MWVLDRLGKKVKAYINESYTHGHSSRVKNVVRLGQTTKKLFYSDSLSGISFVTLQHPVQANYSLQMNKRYKFVYKTYLKLLQDKKNHDDAWEWQRGLWA